MFEGQGWLRRYAANLIGVVHETISKPPPQNRIAVTIGMTAEFERHPVAGNIYNDC